MAQDKFAVESHKKAAAAAAAGKFEKETVPVQTTIIDPKTKESRAITVSADDGIRANSSVQSLAKLPAAFKKDGTTTAGNSSQVRYLPHSMYKVHEFPALLLPYSDPSLCSDVSTPINLPSVK